MEVIRNLLFVEEFIQWFIVSNDLLNEYQILFLVIMVFFILFFDGKGDFINQVLLRDVFFYERIKYLLKFVENIDGKWVYCFVSYFRFLYWVFNMFLRKRIFEQIGMFLKQNFGEVYLIVDELCEMVENSDIIFFMLKIL